MRRDPQTILQDAISAAEDDDRGTVSMLGEMTEEQFVVDRRTQRAVERSFEIIGEAPLRLVRDFPAVAERIPEHRRVIDFRNVLAHGYDVVDPRLVYGLARTRLPALLAALRAAR
jgi:uncharacterized protein with HEPN domain